MGRKGPEAPPSRDRCAVEWEAGAGQDWDVWGPVNTRSGLAIGEESA